MNTHRCCECGVDYPATTEFFYRHRIKGELRCCGRCKGCLRTEREQHIYTRCHAAIQGLSRQALRLLPFIQSMTLDGALRWNSYTLYYATFGRGHNQYRLVKGCDIQGVHLVRSVRLLPLIHAKLAELLVTLGATPGNVRLYEYAPIPRNASQYRHAWLFPDHKQWLRAAA